MTKERIEFASTTGDIKRIGEMKPQSLEDHD